MINEFEKTIQLVDKIDSLLEEHLKSAQEDEEKVWSLQSKSKSKASLKAKHDFLIQAKKEHMKIIKFSLEKLTAKHFETLEKESNQKMRA